MAFSIQIRNDHRKQILQVLQERIDDALELCGAQAERNAKLNLEHAPRRIDTGLLRNSITFALHGKAANAMAYSADRARQEGETIPSGSYSGTAPDGTNTVYIGTNVEYAWYVEEGTRKMVPSHFLRDALADHDDEYKALIERVMNA